jgi:hypothetical protein
MRFRDSAPPRGNVTGLFAGAPSIENRSNYAVLLPLRCPVFGLQRIILPNYRYYRPFLIYGQLVCH